MIRPNRTTARLGSSAWVRAVLLLVAALLLLLPTVGCGSGPAVGPLTPVSFMGQAAGEEHGLQRGETGRLYLQHPGAREARLAPGKLVAAVSEVGGVPVVGAVLVVLGDAGELDWLAKVSDLGRLSDASGEGYVPLDEVPPGARGLRVFSAQALPAEAVGGWYWVVRARPAVAAADEVPGLQRVVEGVARVEVGADGQTPTLELIAGTASEGARLVELSPRAALAPSRPLQIAVVHDDDGSVARAAAASIEQTLGVLGFAAQVRVLAVESVGSSRLEAQLEARDVELAVVLGEPWRVVARPEAFPIERLEPLSPLGRLGLVEHPLWLPPGADAELVARAALGVALLRGGATAPIAAWLLEDVARAGATLSGSEMALRWRLSEVYALARHGELASEVIARLGATADVAAADAVRYRARAAHMALAEDATPARIEAVLAQYDEAVAAYRAIKFSPGVADSQAQKATLLLSTRRTDEALGALSEAAQGFSSTEMARLAGRVELAAAVVRLVRGEDGDVAAARELLASARQHFVVAVDPAGVARSAAWQAVVAETLAEASAHLEAVTAEHGSGSALEPLLVLGEAQRELLAGRRTQARVSWLDAALRASVAGQEEVTAIALARLVDDLEQRESPSTQARLSELAGALARIDSGREPGARATLGRLRTRACVLLGRADAAADLSAWEACEPVVQGLLESSGSPAEAQAVLRALVRMLDAGLRAGEGRRVQRSAQSLAEQVAGSGLGAAAAGRLLLELAGIESAASGSPRTSAQVWQVAVGRLEGLSSPVLDEGRVELGRALLELSDASGARGAFEAVVTSRGAVRDAVWAHAVVGLARAVQAQGDAVASQALVESALGAGGLAAEVEAILQAVR